MYFCTDIWKKCPAIYRKLRIQKRGIHFYFLSRFDSELSSLANNSNRAVDLEDKYKSRQVLPRWRSPIANWMQPERKARRMAKAGSWNAQEDTNRDMMAVGPSVTSLEVPKRQQMKQPMKEEYRPYCKGEEKATSETNHST